MNLVHEDFESLEVVAKVKSVDCAIKQFIAISDMGNLFEGENGEIRRNKANRGIFNWILKDGTCFYIKLNHITSNKREWYVLKGIANKEWMDANKESLKPPFIWNKTFVQ